MTGSPQGFSSVEVARLAAMVGVPMSRSEATEVAEIVSSLARGLSCAELDQHNALCHGAALCAPDAAASTRPGDASE